MCIIVCPFPLLITDSLNLIPCQLQCVFVLLAMPMAQIQLGYIEDPSNLNPGIQAIWKNPKYANSPLKRGRPF